MEKLGEQRSFLLRIGKEDDRIRHPLPVEARLEPAWNLENQCDLLCVGSSVWSAKACELKVVLTPQVLRGEELLCWERRWSFLSGLFISVPQNSPLSLILFTDTSSWWG